MKNLQPRFLKFLLLLTFFLGIAAAFCASPSLYQADSLFKQKKYTQSFEIYQAMLTEGRFSTAMLLKMAYIQEGLGHIGQSLYYLKLYQLSTDDPQVSEKMQEVAAKYNLSGYDDSDSGRVYQWISKNLLMVEVIIVLLIFILVLITFFARMKSKKPYPAILTTLIFGAGLLYLNNFISISTVITKENKVYLMEGPSAGSSVKGIVSDGNQLQVVGKEDVWLKVKWDDKIVFVKENAVMQVVL